MSTIPVWSTSGVNFINILRTAFAPVDPKSVKRYWQLDWILTLLGATGVKAVRKYVDEIEPRDLQNLLKAIGQTPTDDEIGILVEQVK